MGILTKIHNEQGVIFRRRMFVLFLQLFFLAVQASGLEIELESFSGNDYPEISMLFSVRESGRRMLALDAEYFGVIEDDRHLERGTKEPDEQSVSGYMIEEKPEGYFLSYVSPSSRGPGAVHTVEISVKYGTQSARTSFEYLEENGLREAPETGEMKSEEPGREGYIIEAVIFSAVLLIAAVVACLMIKKKRKARVRRCPRCGEPYEKGISYCIYCEDGSEISEEAAESSREVLGEDINEKKPKEEKALIEEDRDTEREGVQAEEEQEAGSVEKEQDEGEEGAGETWETEEPVEGEGREQAGAGIDVSDEEERVAELDEAEESEADIDKTPVYRQIHAIMIETRDEKPLEVKLDQTRKYLIGRHETADIALSDDKLSPIQAELSFHEGAWLLKNLNQALEMTVNGAVEKEHVLKSKDEVRIGQTTIRYSFELKRTQT